MQTVGIIRGGKCDGMVTNCLQITWLLPVLAHGSPPNVPKLHQQSYSKPLCRRFVVYSKHMQIATIHFEGFTIRPADLCRLLSSFASIFGA